MLSNSLSLNQCISPGLKYLVLSRVFSQLLPSREGDKRAGDILYVEFTYVLADLGSWAWLAKESLDEAQVGAVSQQVGGEGVPERV